MREALGVRLRLKYPLCPLSPYAYCYFLHNIFHMHFKVESGGHHWNRQQTVATSMPCEIRATAIGYIFPPSRPVPVLSCPALPRPVPSGPVPSFPFLPASSLSFPPLPFRPVPFFRSRPAPFFFFLPCDILARREGGRKVRIKGRKEGREGGRTEG